MFNETEEVEDFEHLSEQADYFYTNLIITVVSCSSNALLLFRVFKKQKQQKQLSNYNAIWLIIAVSNLTVMPTQLLLHFHYYRKKSHHSEKFQCIFEQLMSNLNQICAICAILMLNCVHLLKRRQRSPPSLSDSAGATITRKSLLIWSRLTLCVQKWPWMPLVVCTAFALLIRLSKILVRVVLGLFYYEDCAFSITYFLPIELTLSEYPLFVLAFLLFIVCLWRDHYSLVSGEESTATADNGREAAEIGSLIKFSNNEEEDEEILFRRTASNENYENDENDAARRRSQKLIWILFNCFMAFVNAPYCLLLIRNFHAFPTTDYFLELFIFLQHSQSFIYAWIVLILRI